MTSTLDVPVAVNSDSGTNNLPLFANPTLNHPHVLASAARRTGPPREMAA